MSFLDSASVRSNNNDLLEQVLKAVKDSMGLVASVLPGHGDEQVLRISLDSKTYDFRLLFKVIDRRSAAALIQANLDDSSNPTIVVTEKMTAEMARECRKRQVQFLDACGNAYLSAPGLLVYVEGRTKSFADGFVASSKQPSTGVVTSSALRVVFALLTQKGCLQNTFREIAQSTGVSLGSVSAVFDDLTQRGFIKGSKRLGRQLLCHRSLQTEWLVNYDTRLRPKLMRGRYRSEKPNWWRDINLAVYKSVWGGEVAADMLTNNLRPNAFTLYIQSDEVDASILKLVRDHQFLRDPQGNIELLEAFWPIEGKVCPPLLVYADLINSLEPRNLEVADTILKSYL